MKCPFDPYASCNNECPCWLSDEKIKEFEHDVRENLHGAPLCPSHCSKAVRVFYQDVK